MGVPKFFMYMSERYPCLSELAREQCIPDFDNLYLDMNGIIHNCSHPDDGNYHFSLSEEDMFKDIFNYIDKLFFLIKPQKLFFLAVDGVAPRAKMNQQRSRRFRSAKEAEVLEEKAKQKGLEREEERFDSNCITPGTEFMQRLQNALRYFIKNKLSNDPMWQKCRIILSGHDTPGEGEHKIMDYIRYMKSQPDYNPNTRHCLYGLDADLIILGLCTHELHFVVLREEVKFGKKTKHVAVEETRFFLLHLGLFREYLELEFDELRQTTDTFDVAQLIDDWVLMSFLVGNDFVPHLPCLHISSNALPLLYKTYIQIYPTLGGNINEGGKLNLKRLEKFFAALTDVEYDIFKENHADLVYFDMKSSKNGVHEAFDFDVADINNTNTNDDLAELIENSRKMMDDDDDEDLSDEETHLAQEFETYKRDYYRSKLNKDNSLREVRREQAISYVTALQWILDYYYRGVQSWNWYYPYHYAPFISDLKDFRDHKIKFDMGKPFLPFEQLLGVLPAASKKLLPAAYHDLMTSEHSEIIQFYPQRFETDLNGKKQEWEAVVLIPFIDEVLLLNAMKACEKNLTKSEVNRNKHGPMLQYDHTEEDQGPCQGVSSLKPLYHVFCTETTIWARDIAISTSKTMCAELPNASRKVFFPGFPTMKHLKFNFELKNSRVRVFDRPSRNNTMVLIPELRSGYDNLETVAEKLLGKVVYIGWPHLVKAKVVAVSNADKFIERVSTKVEEKSVVQGASTKADSDEEKSDDSAITKADAEAEKFIERNVVKEYDEKTHNLLARTAEDHLTNRMGIEMLDFSVMVHVKIYTGTILSFNKRCKVTTVDSWSATETTVPANIIVSEIVVHSDGKQLRKRVKDVLQLNLKVFFLGHPHFGSEGRILDTAPVKAYGRVQVGIISAQEPELSEAKRLQRELESVYVNSYQAACQMGIGNHCVARITGSVLVIPGARRKMQPENISKTNIGLQLKFPRFNQERIGYTRRINQNWYYSARTIDLILAYQEKFPEVFDALSRCNDDNFFESDIFPDHVGESRLEEICTWLKTQEHLKASVISCGSKTIEKEAAEKVFEAVEEMKKLPVRTVKLQVKPHLLVIPNMTHPEAYKSKSAVRLFDRVVIVKDTYMVPIGAKGTVVGIYPVSDPNPVRLECVSSVDYFYDILFDKDMPNGNDIHGVADQRVVKVPEASLLLVYTPQNGPATASENRHSPQKSQYDNWRQPAPGPSSSNNNNNNHNKQNHQNNYNNNYRNDPARQPSNDNERPSTSKKSNAAPAAALSNQTTHNGDGNLKSIIFQSSNIESPSNNVGQRAAMPQFKRPNGSSSHDDFWTPNVNTVRKHTQPFGAQQLPQQPQQLQQQPRQLQQQQHQHPQQRSMAPQPFFRPQQPQGFGIRPTDRVQDETTILKNLLGLSMQDNANGVRRNNNISTADREVQLPQPPQCWRSDAQRSNMPPNHNNAPRPVPISQLAGPHTPGIAYGLIEGQLVPLPGHHQQMPMRAHGPPPPHMPPAPSNEQSFSPDSLFKKGAFIPLQAMRQTSTSSGQHRQQAANNSTERRRDMPMAKQQHQHKKQQQQQQQDKGRQHTHNPIEKDNTNNAGSKLLSQPQGAVSSQTKVKRQERPSKIGAKFDNMP